MRNVLGDEPWAGQISIFESVRDHQETAVKSCHGIGKSWSAGRIALWFLYSFRPSLVITTAPTNRQVRGILWKEIRTAHARARYPLGGKVLTQEIKLDEDWFAIGFTAPEWDPDRFQGFHAANVLVIVDEACGVSMDINEAISGVLTGGHTRKLEIGNPTDPNTAFGGSFKTPGVSKLTISAFDTPNFTQFGITQADIASGVWDSKITGPLPVPHLIDPANVAKRFKRHGPDSPLYRAKVLAEFPEQGTDTLIPLAWIEAAQRRKLEPTAPNELGVDVARFGDDETVIYQRRGPVLRCVYDGHMQDTMQTTGHVVMALAKTGARAAKVDVVGVGGGVVDRLAELKKPVRSMNAGSSPQDGEKFLNARAEWYWGLRERFETGDIDIDPDDEDLASQLASIKWKPDSRGRIVIESKDDMRRRGMASPDRADGAMLAFGSEPASTVSGVRQVLW